MAFGRLTTKWRVVRNALNFSNAKNAKIIRVCTKLHNYCIRMQQLEGGGRIGPIHSDNIDPAMYGIDPLAVGEHGTRTFGFMETTDPAAPHTYSTLTADSSRRDSLVADVESRMLQRPWSNRQCNG